MVILSQIYLVSIETMFMVQMKPKNLNITIVYIVTDETKQRFQVKL